MRVLVLTHRLPYAPNRGDRIRIFHMLGAMTPHFDVELVSFVHDAEEARHAGQVAARGITTTILPISRVRNLASALVALPTDVPLTHRLLASPRERAVLGEIVAARRPDVVFAYGSGMARLALEPPLAGLPFVLDMVDLDSVKWRAFAATARPPKSWIYAREARTLGGFERLATGHAAVTLVVNEREREAVHALRPDAEVRIVENGVDVDAFPKAEVPFDGPVAVFCGIMGYGPNADGAVWAARAVWPLVLARRPDAHLMIVGAQPTAAVRALAGPNVTVTGRVPDTWPYLRDAAVGLAPLATARGVQNKVLEAVAAGLPAIVTPAVRGGLPAEILPACRVAGSPEAFADAVLELLALTPGERRAMAERADIAAITWPARLATLPSLLSDIASQSGS